MVPAVSFRMIPYRELRVAREDQSGWGVCIDRAMHILRKQGGIEMRPAAILFVGRHVWFPPDAIVQPDSRGHFPRVLNVHTNMVLPITVSIHGTLTPRGS